MMVGSFTDALSTARNMVPRVQFAGTPDTLEYLKRGGRLKGAQALMANILNIRPVLSIVGRRSRGVVEASIASPSDVETGLRGC